MLGHFHWVLLSQLHALIIMQLELNGKQYLVETKEALQVSPGLWKKYYMRERESSDLGLFVLGRLVLCP